MNELLMVAAIPTGIWLALFFYLARLDKRLRELERR
jgi:hypothetical protein